MAKQASLAPCVLQKHGWIFATILGTTAHSLLLASPSWGEDRASMPSPLENEAKQEEIVTFPGLASQPSRLTVPSGNGAVISDIQVRFVDEAGMPTEGTTQPHVIIQKFGLQPGDVYDPELALAGLGRIDDLLNSQQTILTLEPTTEPDQVVMVVTVGEPNDFFIDPGLNVPRPTALQGIARPSTVPALSNQARGISGGVRFGVENIGGNHQTLSLGVEGGENTLGVDLDFRQFLSEDSGYGVNFANRRGVEPEFVGGDTEVETASGDEPWIHRLGGGVEYFRSLSSDLDAALGLSYQRVSVREDVFSNNIVSSDALGNALTVSNDGQDHLLTVNLTGVVDRRNETKNPTQGSRLLFGLDQSIPIGEADILFTRLSGNYTQFVPLNLFGFTEGPRTLVLNVQGGTILGDTPPYEAFSLGGSSSVRGYGSGEVGTGESFLQATAEYRFPMFSLNAFDDDIDFGGTLFFDYASDLGTGDNVIGRPADVRGKPGDGFGYGIGVRALTSIGPVRLEFGINDEGDNQVIFKIGDRF